MNDLTINPFDKNTSPSRLRILNADGHRARSAGIHFHFFKSCPAAFQLQSHWKAQLIKQRTTWVVLQILCLPAQEARNRVQTTWDLWEYVFGPPRGLDKRLGGQILIPRSPKMPTTRPSAGFDILLAIADWIRPSAGVLTSAGAAEAVAVLEKVLWAGCKEPAGTLRSAPARPIAVDI